MPLGEPGIDKLLSHATGMAVIAEKKREGIRRPCRRRARRGSELAEGDSCPARYQWCQLSKLEDELTGERQNPTAEQRPVRALVRGLYPLGTALVLFPLTDIAAKLLPLQAGNLQWRFASIGLVASSLAVLLLGLGVLSFTAALHENRLLLRSLGAVSYWLAAILFAALALFVLDFLQLRGGLAERAMEPALRRAAAAALIAGLLSMFALIGLGGAAWAASRVVSRNFARPAHNGEMPDSGGANRVDS
jgi:hypothetical protein